jgi:hypothetical protein
MNVFVLALERVELTPQSAPEATAAAWIGLAVLAGASLAAGAAVSRVAWRDPQEQEPAERAFRVLARRLRLAARDRAAARAIAERAGIRAVSLLVSEGAFDAAAAAADHPRAAELRRRLFSGR